MKKQNVSSLGLVIAFMVPETVSEFDQNAKREGACLGEAINNILYRSTLAEFRDVFLHGDAERGLKGLDELTGVDRNAEKNEKGEIVEWTETEAKYFARVCATKGCEPSAFQTHADSVAAAIAFDASSAPRKVGAPRKIAKVYLDAADTVISAGKADAVAAALSKLLGTTVTADKEGLAKGISANEARKRAEEQKKMAASYTNLIQ
jgi:hypothetical protein